MFSNTVRKASTASDEVLDVLTGIVHDMDEKNIIIKQIKTE